MSIKEVELVTGTQLFFFFLLEYWLTWLHLSPRVIN